MLLADLVAASAAVAGTRRRLQKVGHLRELLERLAPDETATAVAYLAGRLPQGRIGIGPAAIAAPFRSLSRLMPRWTLPTWTRD